MTMRCHHDQVCVQIGGSVHYRLGRITAKDDGIPTCPTSKMALREAPESRVYGSFPIRNRLQRAGQGRWNHVHEGNGRVILLGKCARDFESRHRQLLEIDRTQDSLEHVCLQRTGLGPTP